jgi:hypothetical protein
LLTAACRTAAAIDLPRMLNVIAVLLAVYWASPIPCWKVKAAVEVLGEAGAEKEALARGYTKEQVAEARKRCLAKG